MCKAGVFPYIYVTANQIKSTCAFAFVNFITVTVFHCSSILIYVYLELFFNDKLSFLICQKTPKQKKREGLY